MRVHLRRDVKAYCPDFVPVRKLLRELGAKFEGTKEQLDLFYRLPVTQKGDETLRLKLRIEDNKTQMIYYYDRYETGDESSQYQFWDVKGGEKMYQQGGAKVYHLGAIAQRKCHC